MKPGVTYVESVSERAVVDAQTAIPVFVGYSWKVPEEIEGKTGDKIAPVVQRIDVFTEYEAAFGGPVSADETGKASRCILHAAVRHYFDNECGPCFVASVGTYASLADASSEDIATALTSTSLFAAIAHEPLISLVALPDLVLFDENDEGEVAKLLQVWAATMAACEHYPHLFALLDPPETLEGAKQCLAWLNTAELPGAGRSAAYWPHLSTAFEIDNVTGVRKAKVLPPSAAVAAVIQRTDRARGIWKAPANEVLQHIIKPMHSSLEGDQLFDNNRVSINLIRSFPIRGVRVWGCRTLEREPATPWRYVQVRRLATYIETSLAERARFAVFEPNNEITWLKMKGICHAWLRKLWQSGGLFGVAEQDAFALYVGRGESMTDDDIASGRLIMDIAVALLYPAEFIHLQVHFNINDGIDVEGEQPLSLGRSVII
ncbi:phage tail sheath family protein [Collimonas humicola]|uniref:phage tail sheath family protein n=1 Tax=Collimonas humicola TaxID=2825886 RepID=UPI001B8B0FF9|nr:phage tail sheath C-terminal domain-containing protein [Collimonas humicola]